MRTALFTCTAILLQTSNGFALSCGVNDVIDRYNALIENEAEFKIVRGSYTTIPSQSLTVPGQLRKFKLSISEVEIEIQDLPITYTPAVFEGTAIKNNTFEEPFKATITVITNCANEHCQENSTPRQEHMSNEAIHFLNTAGETPTLTPSLCKGWGDTSSLEEETTRLLQCVSGGDCVGLSDPSQKDRLASYVRSFATFTLP